MMSATLAQFKEGIKRQAAVLRRHGLLDRTHAGRSTYTPKRKKKNDDDPPRPVEIDEGE